jgi:hypothetical protein
MRLTDNDVGYVAGPVHENAHLTADAGGDAGEESSEIRSQDAARRNPPAIDPLETVAIRWTESAEISKQSANDLPPSVKAKIF